MRQVQQAAGCSLFGSMIGSVLLERRVFQYIGF